MRALSPTRCSRYSTGGASWESRLVASLLADAPLLEVDRNTHVYNCGDRDDHVYLVRHGQVKAQIVAASGKRCLISFYTVGDVFGETAVGGGERLESAVTLTRTVLHRMPRERFSAIVAANGLQELFLQHLCAKLVEYQRVVAELVTMNSELRLAMRLLALAERFGTPRPDGVHIELNITQVDLAEMVGTTRSRVCQFLRRFQEFGLMKVTQRTRFIVYDAALVAWVEREAGG